jgi:hypothetical protein
MEIRVIRASDLPSAAYLKKLERRAMSEDRLVRYRARAELNDLKFGPWNGPRTDFPPTD